MNHHVDMQDKTLDNALLALRRQIIRSNGQGLDHVEALLTVRGVRIPRAVQVSPMSRGECKRLVLSKLPCTTAQAGRAIAEQVPSASYRSAYHRAYMALRRLEDSGLVVQGFGSGGCLWRLAP